jgi:hypothetical protein
MERYRLLMQGCREGGGRRGGDICPPLLRGSLSPYRQSGWAGNSFFDNEIYFHLSLCLFIRKINEF